MKEEKFCPLISKEKPMTCKKNCQFYDDNNQCKILKISDDLYTITDNQDEDFKKGFIRGIGFIFASIFMSLLIFIILYIFIFKKAY